MDQFQPKVRHHFQSKIKELIIEYVAQVCQDYFFSYNATYMTGQIRFSFENNDVIPIDFNDDIPERSNQKPAVVYPTMNDEPSSRPVSALPMNAAYQPVNTSTSQSGNHSQDGNLSQDGHHSQDMDMGAAANNMNNGSSREGRFSCEYCGKGFQHRHALVKHVRQHTGEKPYDCHLCDKSFAQLNYLIQHTRSHTGEKPYACTQCEKAFATNENLKNHMKFHSGNYPLACPECGKRFTLDQNTRFIKHMEYHKLPKPFKCTHCTKVFKEQYMLTVHMRVHTGEKPYQCVLCGKAYQTKQNLTNHQRTHTDKFGNVQKDQITHLYEQFKSTE